MEKLAVQKGFNVEEVRKDFPILHTKVYDRNLIYLDNGATAQKPQVVIDAIDTFYAKENANIHRGVHFLSQHSTGLYEEARNTIQRYINAENSYQVLFTKGTTDSINLVAFSFGELVKEGDEIIISAMEHHSNIVPWQMLCERKGAVLKVIPMSTKGELDLDAYQNMLNEKTKLVSVTHISNALGTVNPVKEMIAQAHAVGAKFLVDGAQSMQHTTVDVQDLDCDFFAFSGHKVFGPTGVGVLYGKEDVLNAMPPYQGGGDMIKTVTFEKTTYNELPHKFEAGTPNIVGGIALGTAFEYLSTFDFEAVEAYEKELLDYATAELKKIPEIEFYGEAENKVSVISFLVKGQHPYDVGSLLDKLGIAVRTGHHCAQPVMDFYSIPGTIRASFAFYNTKEEVDILITGLKRVITMLS
ncbi:cysteine desulfurase / selenocysteine lyase [Lishizhenia tianjinensis]|uniref:Cysteine desulfurase n=1 Tax=Lishizhenia tianjinensis TaxID=477690 RepID=A0A1I6ZSP8_9FLAO|nr:cysteine desulfurase [Lishizhenia tianjinensis]SFT65716.1 cysteine desulfurase / selenocysteine lyase [Lishizhenia tianjinensis]